MFAYYPNYYFINEPISSSPFYPRTRCSYHNNYSPFYNHPAYFYYFTPQNYYSSYDEEDQREQLLREQEEHEREQEERLKTFYENKARQQAKQPGVSTFTSNHQPKKSFKVEIQGNEEEETKSMADKSRAARKIFNFIKNQSANKRTRKILNKLHLLGTIEDKLKEIHETKNLGNLTFERENGRQVLPISIENKRFLEYEDKIVKLLDKLDGIQSEGVDIIRERRKYLVKFAQTLLDELDNDKENQWKLFSENQLNSDDETLEKETTINK